MATPIFPAHLFNPNGVRSYIERKTLSGGTSLSGVEDTVIIDGGGRWRIEYTDIGLDDPTALKRWDAWNGYLNAGTADVLVPMLSLETAPRPAFGRGLMPPSDLFTNDPLFPTITQFQSPYIVATVTEAAPLRATTVNIALSRGSEITGGEKVSFGDRGYRIRRPLGGDAYQIEPPLRAAVPAGTDANFDWPVVRCRAVPGEDWSPAVEMGRFADTAISFVEVVN
jgi:hypothetical protein